MTLFEVESLDTNDWFDVCPNATMLFTEERKLRIFDLMRLHTTDYDRASVARQMAKAKVSPYFLMDVMKATYPENAVVELAAREFFTHIPHNLLCSILAFATDGSGNRRINFPDKRVQVPASLRKAFGIRRNETHWFPLLAHNESFVRMVAGAIEDKDWELLIYDKPTLSNYGAERNTASLNTPNGGATV